MRQASKRIPESAEKTVRDIRRATRRHHSSKDVSVHCLHACFAPAERDLFSLAFFAGEEETDGGRRALSRALR